MSILGLATPADCLASSVRLPEHAILQLLQGHLNTGHIVVEANFTPDKKCNRRAYLANMAIGRDISLIYMLAECFAANVELYIAKT